MIRVFYRDRIVREIENEKFNAIDLVIEFGKENDIFGYSVNGVVYDLHQNVKIDGNVDVYMLLWDDDNGKKIFWHSTAHLLGEALVSLYGINRLGIGPAINKGFYYDVDLGSIDFDFKQMQRVENKMIELAAMNEVFKRTLVTKKKAIDFFKQQQNEYKCELINDIQDEEVIFYSNGNFTDLCKGPHLINTSIIKFIKLTSITSAYWRGNEKNKQMTRIYGISFPNKKLYDEYILNLEETNKRNHQLIGQNLKLFCFSENVGLGLPMWLPRGNVYRKLLVDFLYEKQREHGYKHVTTPHIGNKKLYITSGHYEKYGSDSFQSIKIPDGSEEFFLKPMNCPHHCEIYKNEMHSYRDLPLRIAEFGTVYRYEQHGELHGMSRTRSFTQDDAHIFCRKNQVRDEIKDIIDMIISIFSKFEFDDFTIRLSLRDQKNFGKYIGLQEDWDNAEKAIRDVVSFIGLDTVVSYGEAAFYGPKIDFVVMDAIGRKWQLGTVQLDYQLPQRFNLTFVNEENKKEIPVMIHRAPLGSIERFTSILLEHTNGRLPLWLVPEQVIILPISEKVLTYAKTIDKTLLSNGIRSIVDVTNEPINKKIRNAELMKIPYMVIIGAKEENDKTITVREHNKKNNETMTIDGLINIIKAS